MGQVEIYSHSEKGYKTMFSFGAWRIGMLREYERFIHLTYLERHCLSDEAFALLAGRAVLVTHEADGYVFTLMEPEKVYNIPKGLWHNIYVDSTAVVIIAENSETGRENSEYEPFDMRDFSEEIRRKIRP